MSSTLTQAKPNQATMLLDPPTILDEDFDEPIDPTKPLPKKYWPKVDHLITEDDTPMDNIFSEKQQRLLAESLYTSWSGPSDGASFIALANVGLFPIPKNPAIVPDVLLSLDVELPADIWKKSNRSYMIWGYGKPPELVIEIVSNKKGEEDNEKLQQYARMKVTYYVIYDPNKQLGEQTLQAYHLQGRTYTKRQSLWFPDLEIGLVEWKGIYEKMESTWLRWCKEDQTIIPTGAERVAQEQQRAERLIAQLRKLGVEPEA